MKNTTMKNIVFLDGGIEDGESTWLKLEMWVTCYIIKRLIKLFPYMPKKHFNNDNKKTWID
ncbi:MAG: hypothetical protein CM15mL4_2840 [uncultured marine virus]|nr:MAG: hypothetical protein CM15mL4_2840 [uncultured marine virus]